MSTGDETLDFLRSTNEKKGVAYRLRVSCAHLTYAGALEPDEYLTHVSGLLRTNTIDKYSIVTERGSTGYVHTHVLLRFSKILDTANCRFFDYEGVHPNIKKVVGPKHWERTVQYHHKQGVPYSNIVPEPSIVERVWKHPDLPTALIEMSKSLRDVGSVATAWNCRPGAVFIPPDELKWRPWQEELYEELTTGVPDERKIIWYCDRRGRAGKTYFAKLMASRDDTIVSTHANIYHTATMVVDRSRRMRSAVLIVIFNFTRTQQDKRIYEAIESLKDGLVTSQKYHGETIVFDVPHVVIFANYLPDTTKMSQDRWDIRIIHDDGMTATPWEENPKCPGQEQSM